MHKQRRYAGAVFGLGACAAVSFGAHAQDAIDWSKPVQVDITMWSYDFAPSQISLQRGAVYRLHLMNTSSKGHNFDAPQLFAASTIAPGDRDKIGDGAVEVGGGTAVSVEFVPATPGTYAIDCSHFLHAMLGMRATAIVK